MTTISAQYESTRDRKARIRESCNWKDIQDVDWDDLDFYLDRFKRLKDKDSVDTSIRILNALKKQLEIK